MERLNGYMDQIKANEALKEKTKAFVSERMAQLTQNKGKMKEDHFKMRKILIAACVAAVLMVVGAGGYIYYQTPVNYVSLDINPSIELGLNAFDTVVSAEAANEDGEAVLDQQDVTNMPVEEAIDALVQEAVDQDFVADDGSSVIAVTAESEDGDKALVLQEKCATGVNQAMSTKNTFAAVYKDCSDLTLRTQAKALGISPGKYKLIKMLQTLDPTITVEQYKDAKVHEIMTKANELLQAAAPADISDEESAALNEITEKVEDTAKQVKEAKENAEEKKNQEQNANNNSSNGNSNNGKKTTEPAVTATAKPAVTKGKSNQAQTNKPDETLQPTAAQEQEQEQEREQEQKAKDAADKTAGIVTPQPQKQSGNEEQNSNSNKNN